MYKLVVDASIVIKWLNPHELLADKANLIRKDYENGLISLRVTVFWDYEVTNGINKAVVRCHLSEEEGKDALALLLALRAEKEPLPSPKESYILARKYKRSVYDSWYLYIAEETGCEFWTADRKLYNAVKNNLSFVKWIEDYQPKSEK